MSYNLLIYPQGQIVNRIDTLSKILDYYEPDLLFLQELKSEEGLQNIVDELNALLGNYESGTYIDQISNPANSWRLQQNMVYNEARFDLEGEETITTDYRDINYFKLRVLDDDGQSTDDLIHTYVTHLKSSQGNTNEQLRLGMAEFLKSHVATLPAGSKIITAGDFNVYYGGEPAYELLLSQNGENTLHDPIDMPGWASTNFPNREILTQSTRSSSLGDGSGGGMDDRFDFILLSDALMDVGSSISYEEGTYKALGNNGTCYNQDLIDCSTVDNVPFDLLNALYYMSDHLPIVLTLEMNEAVAITNATKELTRLKLAPNPASDQVIVTWKGEAPAQITLVNWLGQTMLGKTVLGDQTTINLTTVSAGLYVVHAIDKDGVLLDVQKIWIKSGN